VSDVDNKYASRIYISRRDADDRRVLNEAELISELEKRGFDTVELSELSISEQISLFQEVDIVVGPHGSGFTNTIFADSTAIFEFFPEERVRHFYYCLAHQLGFDYDFLITPQKDNGDIRIDVERAVKRLDNFIYSDI
jgi:capsular polysaccharide biosynthesis protein